MAGQRQLVDFDFSSAEFTTKLDRRIKKLKGVTQSDIRASATEVRNVAVNYVPVLTGVLKNSIVTSEGADARGFYVAIVIRVAYWKDVEFGHRLVAWGHDTGRMVPAQPFIRPALAKGKVFLIDRVKRRS